jgi:glucokinase
MPDSLNKIDPSGPKVCVGAGTGLAECYLTIGRDGEYECYPSEGGSVEYTPRDNEEIRFKEFLKKKCPLVPVGAVASGTGLAKAYEFLAKEKPFRVDPKVHEEFVKPGSMRGKIVAENARERTLCREAMSIMLR